MIPRPTDAPAAESQIARAYDAIAAEYDELLAPAGWVRERLWQRLAVLFPPGARVLDVTAGTGIDAAYLIERGVRVVACDRAPGMLAALRARCAQADACVMDFNALAIDASKVRFDGIISTFAGLNTSADLSDFSATAARLLRADGIVLVHLLNRWPMLDVARQAARLRGRQLWRTLTSDRRLVELGAIAVPHYLHTPGRLYREVFRRDFHLQRVEAQGLMRPVGARWGARLQPLDERLGRSWPWHSLGTFFWLELRRR